MLRRPSRSLPLCDGRIELDARSAVRAGEQLRLTVFEARLLERLARETGDVPRAALRAAVWPDDEDRSARALDHLVARLRKKIEIDPSAPRHLLTARAVGYRFVSATDAGPVSTLPSDVGGLVGRDAELARIEALYREGASLVSIVGGPGIGKTRLAIAHARRASAAGRHVTFVDLAGCGDASELPAALAVALGAQAVDLEAALSAASPRLVVLDNAEHLLPEAALRVAPWVERGAHTRWLVTTREALRLRGEARLPLGPLDAAAALQMFVDRARRLGVIVDDASPTAAAICDTLERRPLALELAAGRLPTLGLDGLVANLTDPLTTLRAHTRDVPARHAGMAEAVSWSWAQLDDAERGALAACASFRADLPMEAALEVIDREDAAALVERLIERSLIERRAHPSGPRLHVAAVIGELARERCAAQVDYDERHARWTLALAERTERPTLSLLQELRAVVSRHGERHPSLALAAALAAARLYDAQLELSDRRALVARAAALAEGADAGSRVDVLIAQAELESFEGETRAPLAKLDEARRLVKGERDRARVLLARARVLSHLTPDEAQIEGEEAGRLAEACGDIETQAGALHVLGILARERGRPHLARDAMQRALLLAERAGLSRAQSVLLVDLANAFLEEGELREAARAYRAAMTIDREMGDEGREAIAATDLAIVEHIEGDLATSRRRHEEALAVHRRLGNGRIVAFALAAVGALAHEQGELGVAERRLLESEEMLQGMHPMYHAYTLACLAAVWSELGDRARARGAIAEAARLLSVRGALHVQPSLEVFRAIAEGEPLTDELAASRDAFGRVGVRLHRAIESRRRGTAGPTPLLSVGPDAAYFEDEEHGRVTLGRRRVLRRILEALARARTEGDGRALSLEQVIEAGWPGERLLPDAAAARAYTAIRELRRAGLTSLRTVPDGYVLDPAVRVERGA